MSEKFQIRFVHRPRLKALLYVCGDCRTGQTLYPEGHGDTYADGYYSYSPDSYPIWKQRLKASLWKVPGANRWLTMIPPRKQGRVLDIGCGCGASLNIFKSAGWETYGTEISPDAVAICRRNHQAFLAGSEFPENFFDWITLDNVLEHIAEPRKVLSDVKRWLKPEGVLSICVPNFGGIDAEFWTQYWEALDPPHHEFHYTAKGLGCLLSQFGFRSNATFQPRFVCKNSMQNAVQFDAQRWKRIQLAKVGHLLAAPCISEKFGFFLTVQASFVKPTALVEESVVSDSVSEQPADTCERRQR